MSACAVCLFIPTYNEAENVGEVVRAAHRALAQTVDGPFRVVVVDDASPDGTGAIADRLAGELAEVEVVHRPGKQGLGRAYLAGLQHALAAGAELVMVMDADLSHDPREIPLLLKAAGRADVVIGSRYVAGGRVLDWPPLRRTLSRLGSLYARRLLGMETADLTGGFRAFRRGVLETVELRTLRSQGYVFNIELAYRAHRAGFVIAEVPITSGIGREVRARSRWPSPSRPCGWSRRSASPARRLMAAAQHPPRRSDHPAGHAARDPCARAGPRRNRALGRLQRSVGPGLVAVPEQARQRPQASDDQHLDRHVAQEIRQGDELTPGVAHTLARREGRALVFGQ